MYCCYSCCCAVVILFAVSVSVVVVFAAVVVVVVEVNTFVFAIIVFIGATYDSATIIIGVVANLKTSSSSASSRFFPKCML